MDLHEVWEAVPPHKQHVWAIRPHMHETRQDWSLKAQCARSAMASTTADGDYVTIFAEAQQAAYRHFAQGNWSSCRQKQCKPKTKQKRYSEERYDSRGSSEPLAHRGSRGPRVTAQRLQFSKEHHHHHHPRSVRCQSLPPGL